MTTIRKKVRLLALVAGLGTAVSICLFIISISECYFKEYTWPLLYFSIPMTLISTIVLIGEYKKLKIAEVIIENKILHIRSAYSLIAGNGETTSSFPERSEKTATVVCHFYGYFSHLAMAVFIFARCDSE